MIRWETLPENGTVVAANTIGLGNYVLSDRTSYTSNYGLVSVPAPQVSAVKLLPLCGRCGKRTVAFEYQRCNVCEGKRRGGSRR